jgi:hypothetical protein
VGVDIAAMQPYLGRWAAWLMDRFSARRKRLAAIRAAWGKPGAKDGWQTARYFELTRNDSPAQFVDDKTWTDLEWPAIFARLDTTMTALGSQVLYRKLRTYVGANEELAQRYAGYVELRRNQPLREAIQLKLEPLGRRTSVADVADRIFGSPLSRPVGHRFLILMCALSLAAPAAVIFLHVPVTLWIAVIILNAATVLFFTPRLQQAIESLENCSHMLRVADELATVRTAVTLAALARLVREAPGRAPGAALVRLLPRAAARLGHHLLAERAVPVRLHRLPAGDRPVRGRSSGTGIRL